MSIIFAFSKRLIKGKKRLFKTPPLRNQSWGSDNFYQERQQEKLVWVVFLYDDVLYEQISKLIAYAKDLIQIFNLKKLRQSITWLESYFSNRRF